MKIHIRGVFCNICALVSSVRRVLSSMELLMFIQMGFCHEAFRTLLATERLTSFMHIFVISHHLWTRKDLLSYLALVLGFNSLTSLYCNVCLDADAVQANIQRILRFVVYSIQLCESLFRL